MAEAIIGAWLVIGQLGRHTPPSIDPSSVDPIAAAEIEKLSTGCRTTEEWAGLGEVYLATGFFPEAEACYRVAAEAEQYDAELAYRHAFSLDRLGQAEDANGEYQRAIRLKHARAADCWYYTGRNHLRLEQPLAAAEAFGQAAELPSARFETFRLLARSDRFSETVTGASQLADEFPTATQPISLRYRLALACNDEPVVEAMAQRFLMRSGRLPNPFLTDTEWVIGVDQRLGQRKLYGEGQRYANDRRFDDAERAFHESLQAGWRPDIAGQLAEVVFRLGRPDEALSLLTEAVDKAGPEPMNLWRLGQVYKSLGQPTKARSIWDRFARIATTQSAVGSAWHEMAALAEMANERERARKLHAQGLLATALDALDDNRPDTAVKSLTQLVELDPKSEAGWFYLGEANRYLGKTAEAIAAFKKCLNTNPDYGRALRAMKLYSR